MAIYEFITIEVQDDPFEIPGEIIEVCDESPHSKRRFTALVRLCENVVEEDENSEEEIDWTVFDGIGEKVSTRMRAEGYRTKSDFLDSDSDEISENVKGLGPGTTEKINNELQNE